MLNRVVFPEPFGPISPAMLPGSTSIVQPLSACTPPNAFETPSVRSSAVITRSLNPQDRSRSCRPPAPRRRARRRQGPGRALTPSQYAAPFILTGRALPVLAVPRSAARPRRLDDPDALGRLPRGGQDLDELAARKPLEHEVGGPDVLAARPAGNVLVPQDRSLDGVERR